MSKRVYISADYDTNGDRDVVNELTKWGQDNLHKVDFIDMSQVASGSISKNNPDCRPCDLKQEFNQQINASSAVIFIVGDRTASRTAGSSCSRVNNTWSNSSCTPYKQNANGAKICKVATTRSVSESEDVGNINPYSYLRHEFEQAKKRNKPIAIVYNSSRKETKWLPSYMKGYESNAQPFWIKNTNDEMVGNYAYIKQVLGYA